MGEVNGSLALREAVNTLTRMTTHRILVEGPDGEEVAKFVQQAPLIATLRQEIRPGMESKSGGGGGDGSSPAPMSLGAYDLLQEIDEETMRQWWIFKSVTRETKKLPAVQGQPKTQPLPVELRIQYWAARAHLVPGGVDQAVKALCGWIRDIEGLFDPVHRRELQGSCPDCEARFVWVEKDGEKVRQPALTAAWSAGGGAVAYCAGCSKRWAGFDMHALAAHVNPMPLPEVVNSL